MSALADTMLLFDEDGNEERRFLPLDLVTVPTGVALSNETMLEVADEEEYWHGLGKPRHVTARTLSEFVKLSEQPVVRIAQFARQWGLLGLCEHEKPATHRLEDRNGEERSVLFPYEGCTPSPAESVTVWRRYSDRFRKFIEVAQRLHRGEAVADDAIWATLGHPLRGYFVDGSRTSPIYQKRRLARAVNLQLAASGIQPTLRWDGNAPTIGFGVFGAIRTSLFSALTMQLALVVSDCKIAICTSCHQTYQPTRRTHPGQSNYCIACRAAGADVKARVQRLRDRRRATGAGS